MVSKTATLATVGIIKNILSNITISSIGLAKTAQPHLVTFWGHARVELGPPGPAQWPEIRQGLTRLFNSTLTGRFLDVSLTEATRNTLVAVEVACWFYVGEMIGRKSIIGYKV